MPRYSEPPFPDSPGSWLTAFRHRVRRTADGEPPSRRLAEGEPTRRPVSPEHVASHVGCSGATVRRWESNLLTPDEEEIARIAEICHLSSLQTAFLSAAFSRAHALPAPPGVSFREFMRQELSVPYPARVLDGLYYIRARNGFDVDPDAPLEGLGHDSHPIVNSLEAIERGSGGNTAIEVLQTQIRVFWMETARFCHRPEYAALLARLGEFPLFREIWLGLATGDTHEAPVSQSRPVMSGERRYMILSRRIFFPPEYQVVVFVPENDAARAAVAGQTAKNSEIVFAQRTHWLEAPLSSRRRTAPMRREDRERRG